ncbi:MAG: hypothetical protein ACI88A_004962, partial [Paraglaciecola sp.]
RKIADYWSCNSVIQAKRRKKNRHSQKIKRFSN